MIIKTEEELWEILGSLEKYNKHIEEVINHTLQQCMLSIPTIVVHHLKNEQKYDRIKTNFFKNNPELMNYKPIVAKQIQQISSDNPSWDVDKVFQEAGIKAKEEIKKANEGVYNGQRI